MTHKLWTFDHKVPVAPLMGFPGAELTGTTILQNLENQEVHLNSLKQLYKRYHPDAMFIMMDLTIEAEALGLKILKPEDASYTVIEHPIINEEDINKLKIPEPDESGRMPVMLEVMKLMSKTFTCKNIAYVIGPYTLAGLLNGAGRVIKNVLKKPDFLTALLEFSTETISKYVCALENAGADAICFLEPTATVLSPMDFVKFSGKYVKELTEKCNIPTILHICGDTDHLITDMVGTGVQGISLDSMVNFEKVVDIIPSDVYLIGNIDPVQDIAYGNKLVVKEKITELLKSMEGRNNFILSTGCDLPKDADPNNISLLFDLARG